MTLYSKHRTNRKRRKHIKAKKLVFQKIGRKCRPRNNEQTKRLKYNFGASLRNLFVIKKRNQVLEALTI